MINPTRLLYALLDGGRARFVRCTPEGAYETIEEMDNGPALQAHRAERQARLSARVMESVGEARHRVGPESGLRLLKDAFVAEAADRAVAVARREGLDEIVVAAPASVLGPARDRIARDAVVHRTLRKILTKTPDSGLGAWLDDARYPAPDGR